MRPLARVARKRSLPAFALACTLAACGSSPPAPEWQMNASSSMQRFQSAWLSGAARAADAEFALARGALASTGQPSLVARAELMRCALQVAALVFEPCAGFEPLRRDSGSAEQAYADYLAGQAIDSARAAMLPPAQRGAATGTPTPAALRAIDDPLSRLVAAGVLVRRGQATSEVLAIGAETASAQGWKRPVLAWLGAQALAAEQRGDATLAQRLRRQLDLAASGR